MSEISFEMPHGVHPGPLHWFVLTQSYDGTFLQELDTHGEAVAHLVNVSRGEKVGRNGWCPPIVICGVRIPTESLALIKENKRPSCGRTPPLHPPDPATLLD